MFVVVVCWGGMLSASYVQPFNASLGTESSCCCDVDTTMPLPDFEASHSHTDDPVQSLSGAFLSFCAVPHHRPHSISTHRRKKLVSGGWRGSGSGCGQALRVYTCGSGWRQRRTPQKTGACPWQSLLTPEAKPQLLPLLPLRQHLSLRWAGVTPTSEAGIIQVFNNLGHASLFLQAYPSGSPMMSCVADTQFHVNIPLRSDIHINGICDSEV